MGIHSKLTLEEICEVIARAKHNAYMGGSNQFDYDSHLIAMIYDVERSYVVSLVEEKYNIIIGRKNL